VKTVTYALPTRTGSNLTGSGNYVTELSYAAYYQFLRNNIGKTTDTVRVFKSIDFRAMGCSLTTTLPYVNVSQPSQGIVQEKPLFTNIDGGIGLFQFSWSYHQKADQTE
jgi:hypothetical protein